MFSHLSFSNIFAVLKKELLHILRDKRSLGMILFMPFLQLLLYGYAINTDIQHIRLTVWDEDQSPMSRRYIQALVQSSYFDVYQYVQNSEALQLTLDRGEAKAALHIPSDFTRNLLKGQNTSVALLVDGTDSNPANTALGRAGEISKHFEQSEGLSSSAPLLDLRARMWYNPELKSRLFMIPGIMGLLLQLLVPMITATALVREKERGTLEQLLVSPLSRLEIILGKLIPYMLVGGMIMALVLSVAYFWFAVPIHGHLFTLITLTFLFITVCLGLGLFASAISQNQQQAAQIVMVLAAPSILLSGFIFPRETMPLPIYLTTYLIPLTYYLRISRGVMLKGLGWLDLWDDALVLIGLATFFMWLASKKFKKQIE